MKAFKDLFLDVSGAEYALAAAIVIAFVMIAAGAVCARIPIPENRRVAAPTASNTIAGHAPEPDAGITSPPIT